ncbi:MAG: hypothetical protein ACO3WU_13620 [Ilumatobacteraceae bacterium]
MSAEPAPDDELTLMNGTVRGKGFSRLLVARLQRNGALRFEIEEWGARVEEFLDHLGGGDTYEYSYTVPKSRLADFLTTIGVDPTDPMTGLAKRWSGSKRSIELIDRLRAAQDTHRVRLSVR